MTNCLYYIAADAAEQTVADGCKDHKVYLLDAESGEIRRSLEGHQDEVICLAFSPGNSGLLAGGEFAVSGTR